ncbi:MAG: 3-oxoacyl-[acyl-carrier-protein] synthase III C-terminal domain-containing protein [Beijerinckiaceae bacterium]|nr:3-oxoacyl-[acyl-carrier-protein] synthase III C-terminal domain-containing protein [Beijerinckiaceae bacterium]
MSTLRDFGNSSAATIPLTLSHAGLSRNIATGDLCLMTAVGAGLTGGAVLFRW